ncbi:V-type ATP synthase subunit I domain-containing protein [Mycoplasmopsis cynos]|uniref:hypothetical protein n=1 Tax=Mycoplasmopsis cynos TaxID=171284 RepID=UPI002AFDF173|nr:hypothetical protein [Mycoplasmopsis cynos]WQQ14871.1 hypothetical protein RRG42_00840 [Mycoplasmopsis cynos]
MSKYKKIFSGLGLLSISTLVGASVVACANKKPKPSDSSTEGIDQNNNQGNSTTPEQEKPETPKEGKTAPETPDKNDTNKDKEHSDLTALKKEVSTVVEKLKGHSKYDELKAKVEKENTTKEDLEAAKTDAINEFNKYNEVIKNSTETLKDDAKKAELTAQLETAQNYMALKTIYAELIPLAKMELNSKIDSLPYPDNALSKPTKDKLKQNNENLNLETYLVEYRKIDDLAKALESKNKEINELFNFSGLKQSAKPENVDPIKHKEAFQRLAINHFKLKLNSLETTEAVLSIITDEYKTKFNKYKELINDEFWGDYQNQSGLNGRLLNFYGEDDKEKDDDYKDKHSEATLIYHIYETIRIRAYNAKIDKLTLSMDKKKNYKEKFKELPDGKTNESKKVKDRRFTHNKDMNWLVKKLNELKTELENAKKEASKTKPSASR